MRHILGIVLAGLVLTSTPAAAATPGELLDAAGVRGGLIVHADCGDGKLTAALRANDACVVHGLATTDADLAAAREHVRSRGLCGPVAVANWSGGRLPYADGIVALLVAERPLDVPADELLRVLRPGGVAMVAGKKTVKPRPGTIDDWTHFLHGPDNNAVARDEVVGIPHRARWVASPRWARHHNHLSSTSAMVTAGGRLLAIMDEGPVVSLGQEPRWRLIARDAFSGVLLWKHPIGPWEQILRPFRSGPAHLSRRLVATTGRVFVTPGYGKPVVALDAATGKAVRTYDATAGATEIVHRDGVLYVVAGKAADAGATKATRRGRYSPSVHDKRLLAIRAATGEVLWTLDDADTRELLPTTLCLHGPRAFFQGIRHVVALDAETGSVAWRVPRPARTKRRGWSTPTLLACDGVVLSADGEGPENPPAADAKVQWVVSAGVNPSTGDLVAYSADDGKELWRCKTAEGYNSPPDVFVVDGVVWTGTARGRNDPDFTEGRDLKTGKVVRRLATAEAFTDTHHHRCYRNKATSRYIVLGRTGIEFIDLAGADPQRHCWVRGACQYGVLPANGLIYAPPHACGCYIQSKLAGLWALAPRRESGRAVPQADPAHPLVKGPAFGKVDPDAAKIAGEDWPTYRHDRARTANTPAAVGTDLSAAWTAKIGGRLSGLVVAGGVALVAAVDAHTVHALDAVTGRQLWSRTVGGRVDSPPTIHAATAVFGCADGWVRCLRLGDGELVWRFRAAPADRRMIAFDQVESVWPVTGSVLIRDGVVYATAGRSSFLDGGMLLHRLDAATGRRIATKRFYNRDSNTGAQPEEAIEDTELPGALPDVLVDDGRYIYLRDKRMEPDGTEHPPTVAHLYSSAGLLDDAWWHRTYWTWGERNWGRASGWAVMSRFRPSGRLMVVEEHTVLGYGRQNVGGNRLRGYHLFRADKKVTVLDRKIRNNNRAIMAHQKPAKVHHRWSRNVPIVIRAMLLADGTLFAAGPVMERKREPAFDDPAAEAALLAFDSEGKDLARLPLPSQPVFDGLAAARGRLYAACVDGSVICLSRKRQQE